jgi:F420H(2)-dependent quinone reductase
MRLDYMDVVDRLSPVLNQMMRGHVLAYRATDGLVGHRFPGAPPMLLLDHVGARTGRSGRRRSRTSPTATT